MKKLLPIILILISCSCKNENNGLKVSESVNKYHELMKSLNYTPPTPDSVKMVGRGQKPIKQFYHKAVRTYVQYQNTKGLAFEVPIERLAMGGGSDLKSIWGSAYFNVGTQLRWVQFGYATSKDYGLLPAFYVWNITPLYGQIATPINYLGDNNNINYDSKTPIRFELKNKPGTTWWVFSRGGIAMFEVDLETDVIGQTNVSTESHGADSFGTELHVNYYQVLQDGIWINVANGVTDGGGSWGMQGKNQISTYNISEFTVGGRTAISAGVYLWGQP